MVRQEVVLQFVGTSPRERATWKRATMRGIVYIPHVSFELLGSTEVSATGRTGRARPVGATRGTISPVFRSALRSEMPPNSL